MNQSDFNHVILSGTVITEPQHRELPNTHVPVCNLKITSVKKWLDDRGEPKTHESQLTLALYGPWTVLAAGLQIGSRITVEGEITVRSTSRTTNSTTTEIDVKKLYSLFPDNTDLANDVESWV